MTPPGESGFLPNCVKNKHFFLKKKAKTEHYLVTGDPFPEPLFFQIFGA